MELYEFTLDDNIGGSKIARYTSGLSSYQMGVNTFTPIPIQRGEISFEVSKNKLILTLPMDYWPASEFKLVNPYGIVNITMFSDAEEIMFAGRVIGCMFDTTKGTARLSIASIQEMFNSQVPVKVYSPSCPYELYGGDCGILSSDYKVTVPYVTTTISAATITNTLFTQEVDGYYEGGWVETAKERTTILSHVGDTLTVMYALREPQGIETDFFVYPGCDKSLDTCNLKYNNEATFGGFPWVPLNNPTVEEF